MGCNKARRQKVVLKQEDKGFCNARVLEFASSRSPVSILDLNFNLFVCFFKLFSYNFTMGLLDSRGELTRHLCPSQLGRVPPWARTCLFDGASRASAHSLAMNEGDHRCIWCAVSYW